MGGLTFLAASHDLSRAVTGTFNPGLVALSVLLASLAAYAALLTIDRVRNASSVFVRRTWFATGAVAMGAGIWTMHFIGMLAYEMEMPILYDFERTALSVLPGIGAGAVALHILRSDNPSWWRLNAGGLLMGGGIGVMHYVGMSAMVMQMRMVYEPRLFGLSIFVAYGLATISLGVHCKARCLVNHQHLRTVASAVLMGLAVSGMHYTAMLASHYVPGMTRGVLSGGLSSLQMGLGAAVVSGLILGLLILGSFVDRRFQGISHEFQASETRTKIILETAAEGIFAFGEKGVLSTFNAAASEIFGIDQNAALGSNVVELLDENEIDGFLSWIRSCDSLSGPRMGDPRELAGKRYGGESFPLEMKVSCFSVDGVASYAAVIRDLSQKRAFEARLLQAEKLESIGQLAAGIAHEINTPAQFVSDNLEFIEDSLPDLARIMESVEHVLENDTADGSAGLAELREVVEAVDMDFLAKEIPGAVVQSRDGIARVAEIVKAMKDFSHPGAEGFQSIDLNRAIESTVTVARNEWKYVAELELDLDDQVPPIPCHAGEVNQSILNILVNAAHAIDERRGESSDLGKIRVSTRLDGDCVRLEIQDDGGGIPAEIQSRVFDPFFTTKGVGKGTGQGLRIAYGSIVEKHGGTLEFEVEEGVGTTFVIRLPLERMESKVVENEKGSR